MLQQTLMFHFEIPPQDDHMNSFNGQAPACFKQNYDMPSGCSDSLAFFFKMSRIHTHEKQNTINFQLFDGVP